MTQTWCFQDGSMARIRWLGSVELKGEGKNRVAMLKDYELDRRMFARRLNTVYQWRYKWRYRCVFNSRLNSDRGVRI